MRALHGGALNPAAYKSATYTDDEVSYLQARPWQAQAQAHPSGQGSRGPAEKRPAGGKRAAGGPPFAAAVPAGGACVAALLMCRLLLAGVQEVYGKLEEPDGLQGLVRLRQGGPRPEDQRLAAEKAGNWSEALTLYEQALQHSGGGGTGGGGGSGLQAAARLVAQGASGRAAVARVAGLGGLQRGYLDCLLHMGHLQGLLTQVGRSTACTACQAGTHFVQHAAAGLVLGRSGIALLSASLCMAPACPARSPVPAAPAGGGPGRRFRHPGGGAAGRTGGCRVVAAGPVGACGGVCGGRP